MAGTAHPEAVHAAGILAGFLERYLPERMTGLHLVGSAVDGDFQPGRSDLDFVGVFTEPITSADFEALGIVHRLYGADPTLPPLGGIWITADELARGPDAIPDGPASLDGTLIGASRGNRNPITWAMLHDVGLTMLGALDRDRLWHDPAQVVSWTRENVETYWAGWRQRAGSLSNPVGIAMLGRAMPAWGVLGISRMHYTLATGAIISKSGAGMWAREVFDARWHRIIDACLAYRLRSGGAGYLNPFARRRDALDYVAMVIDTIRRSGAAQRASE